MATLELQIKVEVSIDLPANPTEEQLEDARQTAKKDIRRVLRWTSDEGTFTELGERLQLNEVIVNDKGNLLK